MWKIRKGFIKEWLIKNINRPVANFVLYTIAFTESSFFPIILDPFLALMVVFHHKKWLKYAFWSTTFSVLGGIFGYIIGYWFFEIAGEPLVNLYNLHEELQKLGEVFADNSFLAIFLAAFTPIPYKIFTIAGGLFHINIFIFITASILGRGIRFFTLAALMRFVGEKFGQRIFKYFNLILILLVILIVLYFILSF